MPVSIRVDPETGVAVVTCTGILGSDDAREGAKALWRHDDWPGRSAVWDFRTSQFEVSPLDVRGIAQFILENQPTPPPQRIAFVTERDIDFGMARMFEAHRGDPRTAFRVFRSYDAAVDWAGAAGDPAVP